MGVLPGPLLPGPWPRAEPARIIHLLVLQATLSNRPPPLTYITAFENQFPGTSDPLGVAPRDRWLLTPPRLTMGQGG